MLAVLKVHVVDGVSHVAAPVARLVALEVGSATLREAHLGAKGLLSCRCLEREQLLVARDLLAPRAHGAACWHVRGVCKTDHKLNT